MKILTNLLVTVLLLVSQSVSADEFNAAGGTSVDKEDFHKWVMVEYTSKIWKMDQKFELGGWFDSSGGGSTSAFSFYMLGTGPEWDYFYIKTYAGIGAISNPDDRVGSYYQFSEEAVVGLRDDSNRRFGLMFKHVSNAGLKQPNQGRDFIGVRFDLPF